MVCGHCGKNLQDHAKFCSICGTAVKIRGAQETVSSVSEQMQEEADSSSEFTERLSEAEFTQELARPVEHSFREEWAEDRLIYSEERGGNKEKQGKRAALLAALFILMLLISAGIAYAAYQLLYNQDGGFGGGSSFIGKIRDKEEAEDKSENKEESEEKDTGKEKDGAGKKPEKESPIPETAEASTELAAEDLERVAAESTEGSLKRPVDPAKIYASGTAGVAPESSARQQETSRRETTAAATTAAQTRPAETTAAKKTGWQQSGGKWYYYNSAGVLQRNAWIEGTYYVGSDGAMLTNTRTPDGYLVGSDGRWIQETTAATTAAAATDSEADYSRLEGSYSSSSGVQIDIVLSEAGYVEGYFYASSGSSYAEADFSGQLSADLSLSFRVYGEDNDGFDTEDTITIQFESIKGKSLKAVRSGSADNDALNELMGRGKHVKFHQ